MGLEIEQRVLLGFLTDEKLAEEAARYGQAGGRPQEVWPNGVLASTAVCLAVDLATNWTRRALTHEYLVCDGTTAEAKRSLIAGNGREAQRAHLAACRRCGVRYRAILRDLDRVTDVLFHTAPPRWSRSPLTRHWLSASASAVAAIAVLIWVESTVWRAVAPAHLEEFTAFLSDVSSAMFSMDVAPGATDDPVNATADDGLATGCSTDHVGMLGCENDDENERTH